MDAAKAAVVATYGLMVAFNGLTMTGTFGEDIGTISDDQPTWITPDGRTFAIWGIIYTLLLLLIVRQCNPSPEDEKLLSQKCPITGLAVRWRIVLAFLCNAAWLPAFTTLKFGLALVIIVAYLGALISVYTALNSRTCTASFCQWLSLAAPIAANASWLVVATCANVFTVGRNLGWQEPPPVGGSARAAAVVAVLVSALGSFLAVSAGDVAWGAVAAWALAGLYRAQTTPDPESFPVEMLSLPLARVASVASAVAAAASLIGCYVLWKQQEAAKVQHALLEQA